MEANAIEIRLRNHDARLDANHRSITTLRDTCARHETEIKVTSTELREVRDDIAEIRKTLDMHRSEQREENKWVQRGLWVAAATFTGFFFSALVLLFQGTGHG